MQTKLRCCAVQVRIVIRLGARHPARVLVIVAVAVLGLALPAPASALEQKLTASDGAQFDGLGASVAIDGDTAVVGAPGANRNIGAVYVFARAADAWIQTARLTASDGEPLDELGSSVAIDGDWIVAGARGDDAGFTRDVGSVYVFARTGAAARSESSKLGASDGALLDGLGSSVAIEGDTIVSGAPGDDVGTSADVGSAYTFSRVGAARGFTGQTAKLTASDGAPFDELGFSVAIDGGWIVAGAPGDDVGANQAAGSTSIFAGTSDAARSEIAKVTASDGVQYDSLGSSVAIAGDMNVAGAAGVAGADERPGSAYTFSRAGAVRGFRRLTAKLTASDRAPFAEFGSSVAIDADVIAVGAPDGARSTPDVGSVYTFATGDDAARTETARLTAADGTTGNWFGSSVAISGGTILAGAPGEDVGANRNQGSASIFFTPSLLPPAAPPGPAPAPATPSSPTPPIRSAISRPSISGFDFSPDVIAVPKQRTRISTGAKGGRFKYTLSIDARITIMVERKLSGRRAGRRCVRPTRRLTRKCTRYQRRGALDHSGRSGPNTVFFSGRIGRRALAAGSYRATITATNAGGASTPRATTFRVVRAKQRR